MLTPALSRGRTGSTGPLDRTCVSTASRNRGPSSPECTDPQRWRPSRRQPRHERVSFVARLLRPAGRHAMVVAHFLNPAATLASRWGRSRAAPLMAGRSSAGQHRVHSCDREKPWAGPRRLGPASRSPHREPALPPETAREQSTRGARSSHPLERGLDRSPVAAAGDRL